MLTIRIRQFLIGEKGTFLSFIDYKRVMLVAQLCLITFILSLTYLCIDLLNHAYQSWFFQVSCLFISSASFLLNRSGRYTAAKLVLGLGLNLIVFTFSQTEPEETDLYLFYFPICLGAMVVFGYEERYKGLLVILFALLLFSISQITELTFIPKNQHPPELDQLYLIIDFGGALISSLLIIYFLIRFNYQSEKNLSDNEKKISDKNVELSKVNAELDSFVYSTSHDLMAPLSSVKGLINITRITNNPDEVDTCISMMEERVISLQKFINDISDYSRNTKIEIIYKNILVHKLVRSILEGLRFYPNVDKINIDLNISPELQILSDPKCLQTIFSNLISNSIKYIDLNKPFPFIKINAVHSNNQIQFMIEDNGVGIEDRYLNSIFEMFYQANEKSEGSGLGLYIAKQSAQKLNGRIQVYSEFGIGTRFEINLPLLSQS
jgi:signal transduction histidine kinase